MRTAVWMMLTVASAALLASGCNGASCETLCREAQDRDCTTIRGDCGRACAGLAAASAKAGCGAEEEAYVGCSGGGDVCSTDARCGGQETALGNCLAPFCAANPGDPDCRTVVGAF
ncbi:MAG: hypothetical protein RLO52_20680 [Sandaracinaceae bacterium]